MKTTTLVLFFLSILSAILSVYTDSDFFIFLAAASISLLALIFFVTGVLDAISKIKKHKQEMKKEIDFASIPHATEGEAPGPDSITPAALHFHETNLNRSDFNR